MILNTVNLFCGMGGDELGIRDAVYTDLKMAYKGLSINHWDVAVTTMRTNFKNVTTLDCKIEEAIPRDLVPVGTVVHLLWASPSCTHHSRAKGGAPRCNQLRSQPEYVTTWASQVQPWMMIVENVPEFREWGPLDPETGTPIKERKGETFSAWVKMIESLGYNVEHRVLCCADYGDATTRRRFFLIAVRRDIGVPVWPEPTHGDGIPGLPQWRGAGECLDLSNLGKSIFGRDRPLAEKTLARVADGAREYWGLDITTKDLVKACAGKAMKPFIVKLNRGATTEDIDDPLSTVLAGGNHHALVQAKPYIVRIDRSTSVEDIDKPVSTVLAGGNHHALVQVKPFIAKMRNNATTAPVETPLTTVSAGGRHHALCSLVCDHFSGGKLAPLDRPLKTQPTHDRSSLVTLVCDHKRNGKARPSEEPLPTQTTKARSSMVTLVLGQHGAAACRPTSKPVPTVACKGAVRLIEPIVIDNANGGVIRGSREPINTITLKDQHMMALPVLEDGRRIDILMRMLTPRELARAHSVPDDFIITGNKTEQTKQIGNSVPVRTARALVGTLLKRYVKKGARDA